MADDLAPKDPGDRRHLASRWFKRQMVARLAVAGLVVFAAVCVAFGSTASGSGSPFWPELPSPSQS